MEDFKTSFRLGKINYTVSASHRCEMFVIRDGKVILAQPGRSASESNDRMWLKHGHLIFVRSYGAHSSKIEIFKLDEGKIIFDMVTSWGMKVEFPYSYSEEKQDVVITYSSGTPSNYYSYRESIEFDEESQSLADEETDTASLVEDDAGSEDVKNWPAGTVSVPGFEKNVATAVSDEPESIAEEEIIETDDEELSEYDTSDDDDDDDEYHQNVKIITLK